MKKSFILLIHVIYWLLYVLLVASFLLILVNNKAQKNLPSISQFMFSTPIAVVAFGPALIGFYSFYSYLFDRFLYKKRFKQLFVAALICILFGAFLPMLILTLQNPTAWTVQMGWRDLAAMTIFLSLISLIHGVIGVVLKGFITWYNEIRVKDELEKRNYEVELSLIKSQLNPHLLFNTINNIDVLIEKDPPKASAYLNKLSGMIRFMLYETRAEKIPFSKELEYIEKYVELQRIRSSNPGYVNYSVKGEPGNQMIEPMLFIPFIENAFKHGESKKSMDAIKIEFDIGPDSIIFHCENRFVPSLEAKSDYGGLGLNLMKRRLELLYPNKHTLDVRTENEFFKINLILNNHED